MLTSDELIKEISVSISKQKVVKLTGIINKHQFSIKELIDITFHPDKDIAFRGGWILENLFLQQPEKYTDDLEYLISKIKDITHPSCERHYAKIIMHITSPKAAVCIQQKLATIDLEKVVEQMFDWMIDPKVLIAVKVFAAQALFNLRLRYTWIAEELTNQIEFLMRNGSAAIQSRGKKLLYELGRI
jgi:hypothetical protein